MKGDPARIEFGVQLRDAAFQRRAGDGQGQIADAPRQQGAHRRVERAAIDRFAELVRHGRRHRRRARIVRHVPLVVLRA